VGPKYGHFSTIDVAPHSREMEEKNKRRKFDLQYINFYIIATAAQHGTLHFGLTQYKASDFHF
jgi:hypothetical protein